jgi:pSer/pThr/pTyr-binding forkhead associated (FHA) protein
MPSSLPTLTHVLIVKDRNGPKAYWLTSEMYSLGRDPSNSIRIDSVFVSRTHAILYKLSSPENVNQFVYQVLDGDIEGNPSTNGLYVNGIRVDFRDLQDGDVIQFGTDAIATYIQQDRNLEEILSTFERTLTFLGS